MLIAMLTVALSPALLAQPLDQQKADAQREVEALQQKLEDSMERYNYACERLSETKGAIETNKEQISDAEAQLAVNKGRLNKRARAMYMSRHNRFVDVVANSKNFDEFLVGLDLTKKVSNQDANLVAEVKAARSQLEEARSSLENQKAEREAATKEMSAAKSAVEGDLSSAQGKLANVEEQVRQAMVARAAAASSSSSRRNSVPSDPISRRTRPPGAPHGGVVGVAYDQLGKPYVYGGSGPDVFDCSGLTMYCYRVGAGISLPHSATAQMYCGPSPAMSELAPGDLVGFRNGGHVGMYVGGDEYIHAPSTGDVVRVASLSSRSVTGTCRPD
ncbi:MAG: C40 family peptidase [Actinobacteria bacterium]|nr:C40 family peptidase [Actinomycetota bacterium]